MATFPAGDSDEPRNPKTSQRFPDELIDEARALFQPQTDRHLTREDGRQILENLVGFFSVLHEWDLADAGQTPSREPRPESKSNAVD